MPSKYSLLFTTLFKLELEYILEYCEPPIESPTVFADAETLFKHITLLWKRCLQKAILFILYYLCLYCLIIGKHITVCHSRCVNYVYVPIITAVILPENKQLE